MKQGIEVITDFDGASPHASAGVTMKGADTFVLRPGLRGSEGISEEVPGKGSRFSTCLRNPLDRPMPVTVVADWETPDRCSGHDLGYVQAPGSADWRMIPGVRDGAARVRYTLTLEPGDTRLGLYPEYNCADTARFVAGLAARGVRTEVIGQSREQRDLWMITLPASHSAAHTFFIQARDHAYETAGSYCLEGIVDFLVSGSELAAYLRSKFQVCIVPMTNPDGVYNGMSRLTWERGANMNRVHTVADAAHDTLRAAIDRTRPDVHMNIHNWTGKFVDGLLANDNTIAASIQIHLPPDHAHFKRWRVQTSADFLAELGLDRCPPENQSWKNYVKEQFDGIGVTFEFPWFGRTTQDMREQGRRAFVALALAAIEERDW